MICARCSRTLLVSALLLALAAASCSRGAGEPADASALPERYRFLQNVMVFDSDLARVRAGLPYQRIEHSEWNPWGLGGPVITHERDGTASMSGSPPKTGHLSIFDFGGLCYLIERIGFESFDPRYAWSGIDASTVTIKVWRAGSAQPIVVEDYGNVGPPDLWTLSTAIEGVAAHIQWK